MAIYSLGIDVGSTTVKTVIIDEKKNIIYSEYQRHFSKVRETVKHSLKLYRKKYPNDTFKICMTGSAGLGLATGAEIPFVQEVNSAFIAVKERIPDADAVIELGGEDAKIIFLTGGVEQRMNGSCAGGTGAFIDQMATLLWSYCYRNGQYVALCSKSLSNRFKMRCICKIRYSAPLKSRR